MVPRHALLVTANSRSLRIIASLPFVRAVRENNRDEMIVMVTTEADSGEHDAIRDQLETLLKDKIGVKFGVEVNRPGALDDLTQIKTSPKPKRFRDERG